MQQKLTHIWRQIIIAGVINGHIASKAVYLRVFAGTGRMHKRDLIAVSSWIGIAFGLWVIAWIIASAIPVFSNLLSLMVGHIHLILFPIQQPSHPSD